MEKKNLLLQRCSVFCAAVILFTICGVCGYLYEIAVTSYLHGHFVNRGFLHIPVLPIYGVFFGGMAITTLLELIASYIIEWVLGKGLWSYRSWDFNFDGRISLYSSIAFGIMSVILIKAAYPIVKKLYEKLPQKVTCVIGGIIFVVIVTDFIYTFLNQG